MKLAPGGTAHFVGPLAVMLIAAAVALAIGHPIVAVILAVIGADISLFMLYFFRDPDRECAEGPEMLLAGADGLIRAVEPINETKYLKASAVRVSIFLSPMDVHVNRSPMEGRIAQLDYTPGRHLLTMDNAASEHNEHSSILIVNDRTRCLVNQIVGPIVRRVVYWLEQGQAIGRGDRIGMMKFGSRLDTYFIDGDVEILVKPGDKVRAGVTPIARLKGN